MEYKGYQIKQSKSGKTFYAVKNGKSKTWSHANTLKWCKKHIDNKLSNIESATQYNNRMDYGCIIF